MNVLASFLAPLIAKLSGPLAWIASLLVDRILKFSFAKIQILIARIVVYFHLKKAKKADEINAEIFKKTLEPGANEHDQLKASLDVLNSRLDR